MAEIWSKTLWIYGLAIVVSLLIAVVINGARVLLGHAQGDAAEPLTARLSSLAAFGGLLLMLAIDAMALSQGAPGHRVLGHWFGSGNGAATLSFMLDPL